MLHTAIAGKAADAGAATTVTIMCYAVLCHRDASHRKDAKDTKRLLQMCPKWSSE